MEYLIAIEKATITANSKEEAYRKFLDMKIGQAEIKDVYELATKSPLTQSEIKCPKPNKSYKAVTGDWCNQDRSNKASMCYDCKIPTKPPKIPQKIEPLVVDNDDVVFYRVLAKKINEIVNFLNKEK